MTSRINISAEIGGVPISGRISDTASAQLAASPTLNAAKAGTLTTRTDNDTGVATVASGHGILDTDTVAVFWEGGRRYNVDVTAVTSTTISIDAGAGDNLPIATTALTIVKQQTLDLDFLGTNLVQLGIACAKRSLVLFMVSTTVELVVDLAAAEPYLWSSGCGFTNPITGDQVTSVIVANADTEAGTELKLGMLLNA